MELHQLLPDFRMENFALIDSMESSLLYIEETPDCHAALIDLLLAINSLKTSVGLFGLDRVVALADAMEEVLVRWYRARTLPDELLTTLLLSCCSCMRARIGQTSSAWNSSPHSENGATEEELLAQLEIAGAKPLHDSASWNANFMESSARFLQTGNSRPQHKVRALS